MITEFVLFFVLLLLLTQAVVFGADNSNLTQNQDESSSFAASARRKLATTASTKTRQLSNNADRRRSNSTPTKEVRVAALYFPVWGHENKNLHFRSGYARKLMGHEPLGGEYDDAQEATIQRHLLESRKANIDLWFTSWMGAQSKEDQTLVHTILPILCRTGTDDDDAKLNPSHKIALVFDCDELLRNPFDGAYSTRQVIDHTKYMASTYWNHSQYYNFEDIRPVVMLKFSPSMMMNGLGAIKDVVLYMRSEAAKQGYNVYIIGAYNGNLLQDQNRAEAMMILDAVTDLDFASNMADVEQGHAFASPKRVSAYFSFLGALQTTIGKPHGCTVLNTISPGFNDRVFGVDSDHPILARKLDGPEAEEGSLFALALEKAIGNTPGDGEKLLIINSFNNWHDDTQIEPCLGETVNEALEITARIEYEGYGDLYLDILRNMTTTAPPILPETPPTEALQDSSELVDPGVGGDGDDFWFSEDKLNVGTYYYPWWGEDFHRNDGYLREFVGQTPFLGEYDDRDSSVILQHLTWSRQANINTWITSWWGKDTREDTTTKEYIFQHPNLGGHRIGIFYETTGRIPLVSMKDDNATRCDLSNVRPDMQYIAETYFGHPNYLRFNGRPVLFIYVTRVLSREGCLEETIRLMREAAAEIGYDEIFLVGDEAFGAPPSVPSGNVIISEQFSYEPFEWLDAVTNYDVYGAVGARGYAYQEAVDRYYDRQELWKDMAASQGCAFIPAASPGYNDRGVRLDINHEPLSRQLSPDEPHGTLFAAGLKRAIQQVDPMGSHLMMINSWNEWHEDTQIEPLVGASSKEPYYLTLGLEYEGYDMKYLDILRRATADSLFDVPTTGTFDREDTYYTQEDATPAFVEVQNDGEVHY